MSKKKGGNVNRLLSPHWVSHAHGEWQLWDRSGQLWRLAERELDQSRTERLYFDPSVPVAASEGAGPMSWVEPGERQGRWEDELRERAFDPSWEPPREWAAPGAQPFEVMRFERDGESLLLFFDWD